MTYIAFFIFIFLLVCRSLQKFRSSCSPFLLSVGDSLISLRFFLSISVISLRGGGSEALLSVFSDSDAAAHVCLGVLSHWLNVIALVQKCLFSPVSLSWEICRRFVPVHLRSYYLLWNVSFFCGWCKSLYLLCLISLLLLIFCFFLSVLTGFSLSPMFVTVCVCVFTVIFLIIELYFSFTVPVDLFISFHCYPVCASTSFLFFPCFFFTFIDC